MSHAFTLTMPVWEKVLRTHVVQNAIIGDDDSLTGGLLGAAVLIEVNAVVVRVVGRSGRLTALFEGRPQRSSRTAGSYGVR